MRESPGTPTLAFPSPRWRTLLAALAWTAATLCALVLAQWGVKKWVGEVTPRFVSCGRSWPFEAAAANPWTSVGTLTGIVVGFLAGVRSRSLLGWVVGPTLGMTVAALHYHTCTWLVAAGVTERHALLLPTSGLVVGWVLGSGQRTAMRATIILVLLALVDLAGRCAGEVYLKSRLDFDRRYDPADSVSWILSLGPLAVAAVLAAGRDAQGEAPAPTFLAGKRQRRWVGIPLLSLFAGLHAVDAFQRDRVAPVGEDRIVLLPDDHRRDGLARDCAVLDRALLRLGFRPKPQASPPGRDFRDFLRAHDADRRVGYLICPRTCGPFHSIVIGEAPDRSGHPEPVCILAEPWIQDASLVLLLQESNSELDDCPRLLTPDPVEARHLQLGRVRFQQLARAAEVERIASAFAAAIVRRDAGLPTVSPEAAPPHLYGLQQKYGPLQPDLLEARRRQLAHENKLAQVVRIRIDTHERARVLVLPGSPYPMLDGWPTKDSGSQTPRTGHWAQYFWINEQGWPIGDEHESPPDGHPVVEWLIPIHSRWIELWERGSPVLRVDLGPEADAILKRRKSE